MGAKKMNITIKRVYENPSPTDGRRILVDRLWPRGLSKTAAGVDYWAKDLSPSNELRQWYNHDAEKWAQFKERYFKELDQKPEELAILLKEIKNKTATFLFAAKEETLNNAQALKEYILNAKQA